ncbi:C39 family peptidase [Nonomuraea roseola]|uniref:C39 family peptidase n=1 Tax=Nonomuraea roseola TaxID=46179 RepID=UPI0031F86C44
MQLVIAILLAIYGQGVPGEAQAAYRREAIGAFSPFVRSGAWEISRWTGPEREIGFAADELVPSWTADTPAGSWLRVEVRMPGSGWYVMGRWAYGESGIRRTTVKGQADATGTVVADVLRLSRPVTSYQLRATLLRRPGSAVRPVLRSLGAVASARGVPAKGSAGAAWGRELGVPRKSQLAHADHGGRAWCSPTSTAMVVGYWGRGPRPAETAWVRKNDPDPAVDHAARHTSDRAYGGSGNWAFNTAYAGAFGLEAFVTRFPSLAAAEPLIASGVPFVASLSFTAEELGRDSDGHLVVVTGFTAEGDVIANDPAARGVRVVLPRDAFERAWVRSSSGTAYVIHPPGRGLPAGVVTE